MAHFLKKIDIHNKNELYPKTRKDVIVQSEQSR